MALKTITHLVDFCVIGGGLSGLCAAVETGKVLALDESEQGICITEFDIDLLMELRRKKGGFEGGSDHDVFYFGGEEEELT